MFAAVSFRPLTSGLYRSTAGLWIVGGILAPLQGQSISGYVVDSALGSALSLPTIELSGGGRVLVQLSGDSSGYFAIRLNGVPEQPLALRITRIGYAPLHGTVRPADIEGNREYRFALQPLPVRLEEVAVVGEAATPKLARMGFTERAARGFGHFITEEAIALRRPHRTSDLLRVVPGLTVIAAGVVGDPIQVYVRRGVRSSGPCAPTLWLDGHVAHLDELDGVIPEEILGVEVYRGPAEIPAQFGGADAACGVILVWTK